MPPTRDKYGALTTAYTAVAVGSVVACSRLWLSKVSNDVPEPYLDEVFHVRQAQTYCAGRFHEWDPKITTPPGLYMISYLNYRVTGRCDLYDLRVSNAILILGIFIGTLRVLQELYHSWQRRGEGSNADIPVHRTLNHIHTVVNICLFPPLFFFTGLYYTDVASTFFVLHTYRYFLQWRQSKGSNTRAMLYMMALGLASLMFRQTNIFWVAVFPAGLAMVDVLKHIPSGRPTSAEHISETFAGVINNAWTHGLVRDPPVQQASIEDYLMAILSLVVTAARKPVRVILVILPFLFLLALFGAFIYWNGGVVLGDKSNHVATIHLPQMLYVWPYITFFSLPIILPRIFPLLLRALPPNLQAKIVRRPLSSGATRDGIPRIFVLVPAMAIVAVVVRYNTIVHPFTLADNRHYVFYVFRILLRHPAIKYLAAPIYILCGWAVIQTLGNPGNGVITPVARDKTVPSIQFSTEANGNARKSVAQIEELASQGTQTSFVLVWLATTTLSVATAPLVEPRYFIIPWIMWRLHVPADVPADMRLQQGKRSRPGRIKNLWRDHDWSLWLETAWFGIVNLITGYVFLYWGFAWPQEPGRVQRFMW